MDTLFWIIGSTFLVSLVAFVGVLALSFKKRLLEQAMLLLVALSAGALIGGAFLHLIPEAVTSYPVGKLDVLFSYVIVGFVIFFLLEKLLYWRHCHDIECDLHTFGYMNLIGDALHNFIDGLVIAAAFLSDINLGIATTVAIAFHEIPQEIGDFGVLLHSGMKRNRAILLNFMTALASVVGGIAGFALSSQIGAFVPMLLPIAAGGFIYVASSDLIPELQKIADTKKSATTFFVFIFGIVLMWLAKMVFA
jgi:zinc and cadmium transporter